MQLQSRGQSFSSVQRLEDAAHVDGGSLFINEALRHQRSKRNRQQSGLSQRSRAHRVKGIEFVDIH